jgi:glutamyl-tRNA reductase
MNKHICLVGLNHRTAGVEIREAFALADAGLLENGLLPVGAHLKKDLPIKEALVLSTCNRVEILLAGREEKLEELAIRSWAAARNRQPEELAPFVYVHNDAEAVKHLFAVASSLDSMVLGEPQILGQIKDAYKDALRAGSTRFILNALLHRAFFVAKRVRSETGVASSAVSVSYAAVELAKRIFGDMPSCKAMLIGAGEMAELAATHLMNAGIKSILVANRTHERALELASRYHGLAVPFADLFAQLPEVDIVISSTGAPEAVIRAKDMAGVMRRRRNRPMFFIDIAVPRDVDPDVNTLDNIYLYDIDDLKEVVEENLTQRREEAVKALAIVEEETLNFCKWLESTELQPTIVDLIRRSEAIVREEWTRTSKRLRLSEKDTRALELMLGAIVKKINHDPINFLKNRFEEEKDGQYAGLLRLVFNLDKKELCPRRTREHGSEEAPPPLGPPDGGMIPPRRTPEPAAAFFNRIKEGSK